MNTHIVFLLFPGLLQLDFTGPYGVLAAGPDTFISLAWKNTAPVVSSDNLVLTPTTTLQQCSDADVICVPGGAGILPLLADDEVLDFLRRASRKARFVTSVCTGALVLGAAGLLQGFRATTHWQSLELLRHFHAVPEQKRIVEDGNRITAAGVSAGIDMALLLASRLWGDDEARQIQLSMEYAPFPPFNSGTPASAPPHIVGAARQKNAARQMEREKAVRAAAQKLRHDGIGTRN